MIVVAFAGNVQLYRRTQLLQVNQVHVDVDFLVSVQGGVLDVARMAIGDVELQIGDSKNINRTFSHLPAMIGTRVGIITLTQNEYRTLADGQVLEVTLSSPVGAAGKYAGSLTVSQTSKTTTIAQLVLSDEFPQRAIDYLKQLAIVYNRQANEDKNLIAVRTEQFINNRLEKINAELGNTEGELENFKKRNQMVELKINATQAVSNADEFSKRLTEANTQLALLDELNKYMNEPNNNHQPIPSNVGLSDESATALINEYNRIALQQHQVKSRLHFLLSAYLCQHSLLFRCLTYLSLIFVGLRCDAVALNLHVGARLFHGTAD
jgi:uncharacterized protein involved in exopolysaccharide biosynthesis